MCDKLTREFHHPLYGMLNPSQTWELRDELTRRLIDVIGALSIKLSEQRNIDVVSDTVMRYYHLRLCRTIKTLREIDPDWHLMYTPPDGSCMRIMLHDCQCYCKCKKQNSSDSSSQTDNV